MPLLSVEKVAPGVRLGLWKTGESLEDIFEQYPFLIAEKDTVLKSYRSDNRRLEVLTVRLLLCEMVGNDVILSHDEDGRPFLSDGKHVSISHTNGMVAVMVSPVRRVAVDVEFISGRVGRILTRFMRNDEVAGTLILQLLHWCAKETLYKLYPEDKLPFNDMRILSVTGDDSCGMVVAENIPRNEIVNVSYRVFDGFVLTYV